MVCYSVLPLGRYDYLEFTDARGGKVRYDMKVGTEKWPKVKKKKINIFEGIVFYLCLWDILT